jgi:hypothetical protein
MVTDGRALVLAPELLTHAGGVEGRFLAKQPRWNSLRAGNHIGALVGESQQLMDTVNRPGGAA